MLLWREWNKTGYLPECDIELNPSIGLKREVAEWKTKQSWSWAVAHTGVRGDGKWRRGISSWIWAVGLFGLAREPGYHLRAVSGMVLEETRRNTFSFCKETFSCYWGRANPCPCYTVGSVSCGSGPDDQDIGESAVKNEGPVICPEPGTCQGVWRMDVSPVGLSLLHWSCRWK